jgi:carboxyl-terminal processing protease
MQRSWRILLTSVGLSLLVLVSFSAGVWLGPSIRALSGGSTMAPAGLMTQFQVFWQVWNLVTENYVDRSKVDPQQMTYGAIRGMLGTLDDPGHTRFLTSADYRNQENHLEGHFTGIGVVLTTQNGRVVVQEVYPDSPASRGGLQIGDLILKINGATAPTTSSDAAANAIRGPRGSTVRLTIQHQGQTATQDVTLTREDIHLTSVRWQMLPGTHIADIAISEFNQGTTDALRDALKTAKAQGAAGFVVDVRDDPGGLLDEAVSVSSLFLNSGNVLIQRDAHGKDQDFKVQPGAVDTTDPLVVLVNHGTASAAEIFAAAIHDNHRGKLVGSVTTGTGTVLSTYRLVDGSALLLGTAEWLTPDGQSIWKHGVTPDVAADPASGAPLVRPDTLTFPTSDAQVLANGDAPLVQGVRLLESAQQGVASR